MTERTPRRLRSRRFAGMAVAVLALLCLGLGAVWFFLPALLEYGFRRTAKGFGFEEATVAVDRADLTGLRATRMHLRRGGVEMNFEHGAAGYEPGELMDGRINGVVIDGLALTLDFTLPRRGLLPDAVAELLGDGGGGGFAWPVDELTLRDCRIIAILPEGKQSLSVKGEVRRMTDGRVSFDLRVTLEAANLHVSGLMRTETLDGEFTLDRVALVPGMFLEIASQLGLFELPAGVAIEFDAVEIGGSVTLEAGSPHHYSAEVHAPRVRVEFGDVAATITGLGAKVGLKPDGDMSGELDVTIGARSRENKWTAGSTRARVTLENGVALGEVQPFDLSLGEVAKTRLGLRLEAGLPPLGGAARARVTAAMSDISIAGHELQAVEVVASGWSDRVEVTLSELREVEVGFAVLDTLGAVVTDPLGEARAFEGSATVFALPALRDFLPDSWRLVEPALPAELARVEFSGSWKDGSPSAVMAVRSLPPMIRIAAGETSFACVPAFNVELAADSSAISGAFSFDANEFETHGPFSVPGVNAFSFGAEIPRIRFVALASLMDGRFPVEDLAITLQGALAKSAATGKAILQIAHDAASKEWSAHAEASIGNVSGSFAGWDGDELGANLSVDSGAWADARVAEWVRARDLDSMAREIIPGLTINGSLSASAISRADIVRAEWVAASLAKTPTASGAPPIAAKITASAGILRTGPEVLEQPSIEVRLSGGFSEFDVNANLAAMLEGKALALETKHKLVVDWEKRAATGTGTFTVAPFTLVSSDIGSRWVEAAKGLSLTATVTAGGSIEYASDGTWDGSARLGIADGVVVFPAQELRVEGVFADIAVESLRQMRMAPGQTIGFALLTKGELSGTEGRARFSTTRWNRLFVEDAAVSIFGGRVSSGPFSLFFPNPDVAVVLEMDNLDLAQLTAKLEIFHGSMSGRVDGRLPLGLLAGKPIFGQGFLALDPEFPARFSYDAQGIFTSGLPDGRGVVTQVNRLPFELLEEGLGFLDVESFRAELFRRDLPLTPVRIQFSGRSQTPRADVPLDITANINGSVRDIIEFLVEAFVL